MELPHISLDEINLSSPEFWIADRDFREGAFKTLRDESPFQYFEEILIEGSPFRRAPDTAPSLAIKIFGMSVVIQKYSAVARVQTLETFPSR